MLPRKHKVSKNLFNEVFASGKKFRSKNLSLVYAPYRDVRCAVVVSKKTEKYAVKRNMLRRKVKACVIPLLPSLESGVYILFVHGDISKISHKSLCVEVEGLMSEASS